MKIVWCIIAVVTIWVASGLIMEGQIHKHCVESGKHATWYGYEITCTARKRIDGENP
jgi:hypothetical protein